MRKENHFTFLIGFYAKRMFRLLKSSFYKFYKEFIKRVFFDFSLTTQTFFHIALREEPKIILN